MELKRTAHRRTDAPPLHRFPLCTFASSLFKNLQRRLLPVLLLGVFAAVVSFLLAKPLLFVEQGNPSSDVIVVLGGEPGERLFKALELYGPARLRAFSSPAGATANSCNGACCWQAFPPKPSCGNRTRAAPRRMPSSVSRCCVNWT